MLDYDADTNCALLISRYGLDARAYEPGGSEYPTWEKSDIRSWLNEMFLNAAFKAEERAGIVKTTVSTPSYNGHSGEPTRKTRYGF